VGPVKRPGPTERARGPVQSTGMKALVVILRGLPAGAIGPYGNRWIETPTLDALATRGVVYDWHFSVHPSDAVRVWETGRFDFPPRPDEERPEGLAGLLATLESAGVPTYLVNDTGSGGVLDCAEIRWAKGPAATLSKALEKLEKFADEERWFLCVDLSALLPPWTVSDEILEAYFAPPPEEEDDEDEEEGEHAAGEYLGEEEEIEPLLAPEGGAIDPADDVTFRRIQTTFAAAVTQLDLKLEELLSAVGDDVLVIVTSDRGQALGERGVVGSVRPWLVDHRLHEEIVHVPLILAGPGCPAGRRIEALTASVDLAPTLAAHFGVPLEGEVHGHDLHPAVIGEEPSLRDYLCLGQESLLDLREAVSMPAADLQALMANHQRPAEWAIRTPDWSLRLPIHGDEAGTRRLYVKPDDRYEVNDVSQAHFEQADALERTLRAFVEATRAPGPLQAPPLQLDQPAPGAEAESGPEEASVSPSA